MTTIDSSYFLSNKPRGTTSSNLGKDEFMRILMAQLQNQDPLNPMEDKEFISQMANFSSLEQTIEMNESISQLVKNQTVSPVVQYSHLIGKEVSYYNFDQDTGELIEPKEIMNSSVMSISQKDGYAVLELENDRKLYTDEILKISQPSSE